METTLLFLAACLMFSGVHTVSQSMSCSTVNGKTICNKQTSEGNSAMAASQAAQFGGGSSYQRTYAGAGFPNQWDSSSQTLRGGYPGGFYNPPYYYDSYDTQETPGSFGGYPGGFYNPPAYYDYYDTQETPGSFGGFAAAGNFPFFSPGVDYPAQDSSSPFGGAPAQGSSYAGPMPAPMNPFDFVNGFMGGRPAAGAWAGAFPFGRR